jgi:small subunit ribosomal protein S4
MLPIPSKFKIAKRLGAAIFEKTQSQKFAMSEARSAKNKKGRRGGSDYGKQMLEKQKVRFTYSIAERQLYRYAHEAMEQKDQLNALHQALEMRLDSVAYRLGFAKTRRHARQLSSHGHFTVNGKKTTIPSQRLYEGDVVAVREGSRGSGPFSTLTNKEGEVQAVPAWLTLDDSRVLGTVKGTPRYEPGMTHLDYASVFEFYNR